MAKSKGNLNAGLRLSGSREIQRWFRRVTAFFGLALLGAGQLLAQIAGDVPAAGLRVAAFVCDVTPPTGHPLCGGWIKPVEAVDDPLLAKGVILSDGQTRYVLCAVDWCLLQTTAHDLFVRKLAAAAGIPESQVTVHTVHQHNAPIADARAQELLSTVPAAPPHLDLKFMGEVSDRVAASVKDARGRLQAVTHVGFGRAKVEKFASYRRVRLADGRIHPRSSSTKDPALQAAPEGLIDPWLRTVTLFDGEKPLARLHYYASHPMSYYGDGRVSSDTAGLARRRLEQEEGVPQIYFNGCGGDVAAGKYNDGTPKAREELTGRLYIGMKQAIAATKRAPATSATWKTSAIAFAARTEPAWSEETARKQINDTNATAVLRIKAALNLAWLERLKENPLVTASRLTIGPVTILHLPGEAFVEYQLYAHALRPDDLLVVAAYGESGPGYICCDDALTEGGYEPTLSRVGPPTEFRLKAAIADLLRGTDVKIPIYPDKQHLLMYRDDQGGEHRVATPADWEKRRAHILANFEKVAGADPPQSRKVPLDMRVLEEVRLEKYLRRKITFAVEAGDRVPAYLLVPIAGQGNLPAMLCLHQTTPIGKGEPAGLGGKTNLQYAHELAERGYVALAPDYPNFGDYQVDAYQLGYASATMKGIWNHRRAVDLLASLSQVDKERIGVIGHSLGGHNALFAALYEPRLKAVVASCGFNSFFKYAGGDLTGWSHAGYLPRIASVFGKEAKQMPFDFSEILAALAPRPVFINAPMKDDNFEVSGVKDCVIAAAPVYKLLGAEDRLKCVHPDGAHDFPGESRRQAYEWLDRHLRP